MDKYLVSELQATLVCFVQWEFNKGLSIVGDQESQRPNRSPKDHNSLATRGS